MRLSLDVNKTKAVLVGVSEYDSLPPIGPATGNLEDLKRLLTDARVLGLPEQHIHVIPDKKNDEIEAELIEFLDDPANVEFETLLFYYVGHGIRDSAGDKELYLTGKNTRKKTLSTSAIRYNTIKQHIERSNWQQRIVILDACHSGLAAMGESELQFTDGEIDLKGTYVLTSAADEKSFFDTAARHTFFSGALIQLLEQGLPTQQAFLSLEDIFHYLQRNLKQSTPQRKSNLNATDFFLLHNRQFDEAAVLETEAGRLFEAGQYEQALKTYREALGDLAAAGQPDQARMERIRNRIEESKLYQKVKNQLLPGLQQAFAAELKQWEERAGALELEKERLQAELTRQQSDYAALLKQKTELERELTAATQNWESVKALMGKLEAEKTTLQREAARAAQLQTRSEALEKEKTGLAKDLARVTQQWQETKTLLEALKAEKKPAVGKNYTETVGPIRFEMIWVKGGTFQMGSNDNDWEKPVHPVTVSDFYMGKCPVTVAEYLAFCESTGGNWPEWLEKGSQYHIQTGTNDLYKKLGAALQTPDHPITGISWTDAVAYCRWLSEKTGKTYRMPTEAEWEYAAGGGAGARTRYAGTDVENELAKYAWYSKNSGGKTHAVGTLAPNALGLHDLSGNVWEWCSDRYGEYPSAAQTDPTGPVSGSSRVNRGGGWYSNAGHCRVAFRDFNSPGYRYYNLGFRVVSVPQSGGLPTGH